MANAAGSSFIIQLPLSCQGHLRLPDNFRNLSTASCHPLGDVQELGTGCNSSVGVIADMSISHRSVLACPYSSL